MERILLALEHKENLRLLEDWLARRYQVVSAGPDNLGQGPFDLGILDGPCLDRFLPYVQMARHAARPMFLPFLLVTSRQDVRMITRHLWQTVDDLIWMPVERIELEARVEILLRARRLSIESETRYHTLSDSSPVGVFIEQDDRLVYVNKAMLAMTGRTRSELIGATLAELVCPQDQPMLLDYYRQACSLRQTTSIQIRLNVQPAARWVQLSMRPIDYRGGQAVLGIATDMSELLTSKLELERMADQIRVILESAPEGILLVGSDGTVLQANQIGRLQLEELTGLKQPDKISHLAGRPLADLLRQPPSGQFWHQISTKDHVFEVTARPIKTSSGQEQWVVVIRDVTESRRLQQLIYQQERLAIVGRLAAGIAHDFGNILSTIILYAKMLEEAEGLDQWDRQKVTTICQQAMDASRLIEQILDFSRQSVLEQRPLDLVAMLHEQVELLGKALPENIKIILHHDKGPHIVDADPTRMRQMVMNLALNARDAMPAGGTISITVDRIDKEQVCLPEIEKDRGPLVRLTFTDTGYGIPPDVIPHIFEPFFSTKGAGKGSGLGLPQVHGIVRQHGGQILVESQVGKGTTFTIFLPCVDEQSIELEEPQIQAVPRGHGELVLVVEDDDRLRTALVEGLRRLDYEVLQASDGHQALEIVRLYGQKIAAILSDVVMPGVGGIQLLKALRDDGRNQPVILISGHVLEGQLEQARSLGQVWVLAKPTTIEAVACSIARAISGQRDLPKGR